MSLVVFAVDGFNDVCRHNAALSGGAARIVEVSFWLDRPLPFTFDRQCREWPT